MTPMNATITLNQERMSVTSFPLTWQDGTMTSFHTAESNCTMRNILCLKK